MTFRKSSFEPVIVPNPTWDDEPRMEPFKSGLPSWEELQDLHKQRVLAERRRCVLRARDHLARRYVAPVRVALCPSHCPLKEEKGDRQVGMLLGRPKG